MCNLVMWELHNIQRQLEELRLLDGADLDDGIGQILVVIYIT